MPFPPSGCACCGGALSGLLAANGAWRSGQGPRIGRRGFVAAAVATAGAGAAAQPAPATVFAGGTILTVDARFSEAEAVAIRGNRILAAGTAAAVRDVAGPGAAQVDLAGRTLMPGFVDPHTHAIGGAALDSITENVGASRFPSAAGVLDRLRALAAAARPGEWVLARNFDPSLQDGPAALTFAELDAVSAEVPVFVLNASGHLAYANRAAFRAAGIPEDVANPPGAEFVRDAAGRLTGEMKNVVAFIRVLSAAPAMGRLDPVEALIGLMAKWNRVGLTTVSELSLGTLTSSPADARVMAAAAATGRMTARLRAYPFYTIETAAWDAAGVAPGTDPLARIAGFKLVADGSNQGFTGLQREPYLNSTSRGIAYMTPAEMTSLALDRARRGWPLALHANGDAGVDMVLDTCQALRDAGVDLARIRPRIEHCSMLHDEQIARMRALGVSASFLIGHAHFWGVWMRDRVFGPERVRHLNRLRSTEAAGVGFSLHSDFPVTDPEPLHMIEMAVTRRTWREPEFVLNPAERIAVESAIRAVTSEAAWQMFSEHEIGSIEAGKLADLVILEQDPRRVAPDAIRAIRVSETWMDGRRVYAA